MWFICTCCHQKLFESQVELYTKELKKEIDRAYPNLREDSIAEELITDIKRVEDDDKDLKIQNTYICTRSCKKYLKNGKIPKFCVKNGLEVDEIEEQIKLTELENNLIARNIIFQKIHKLPKSR